MPVPRQSVPPPKPPAPAGAWTPGNNGSWNWTSGATPDPKLTSQWGYQAITDPRQDPSGHLASGAWQQSTTGRGGGWVWVWGAQPSASDVQKYGAGKLTDPAKTPSGAANQAYIPPPPPNVVPPTIDNSWDKVPRNGPSGTGDTQPNDGPAPDLTGATSKGDGGGGGQTVSQPPSHRAYVVSPGDIRNAENRLSVALDTQRLNYDSLKAAVASGGQDLATTGPALAEINNAQNQVLQQIADALEGSGQFMGMLNNAAQNYTRADMDSFINDA
jgi:hypothetical protein